MSSVPKTEGKRPLAGSGPDPQENGADYYAKMGFKYYYFITTTNIVPTAEFSVLVQNAEPALIKNPRGDVVFKVYKTDKI